MSDPMIRLNGWTYAPDTGRLSDADGTHQLSGLTARVLDVLIAHAPEPVSLGVFAEQAWKQSHLTEDTLAQRIALLRKSLGDDPRAPSYIRTVRGEGYALIADLAPLQAATPDTPAQTSRMPWELLGLGGAILGLIAILAANMMIGNEPERTRTPSDATVQQPSSAIDSLLERARALTALQDRDGVQRGIRLLEDARLRAPDDPRLMTALAVALSTEATKHGGQRMEEAEALARNAIERAPESPAAWRALGYALDAQDRIDEALEAYGQSLALDPDDGGALSSAAYLLSIRGRLYEALTLDVQALQKGRGGLFTELQIARVLQLLGEDQRADAFAARAQLLNPDSPVVLAGLAQSAIARGDVSGAATLLNAAPEREQRGQVARLRGRMALANGDRAQAADWFERAGERGRFERFALAATEPDGFDLAIGDWPESHVRAAEIAAARGDYELALTRLSTAIRLGWRDEGLLDASPFLDAVMALEAANPLRARIQQHIAAQADRLDRDENLSEALDAVLDVQR